MSIEFDFYKTNGALAHQDAYHVRVVDNITVSTETLISRIQQGTTLTRPDLEGAISALSQAIINELKEGRKVHLKNLGYFSLAIDGKVDTDKNGQLRLKSPCVRTVKFKPEEQFMKQMGNVSFSCRQHKGRHSQELDDAKITQIIEQLLNDKAFFNARDFCRAAHVTTSTGYRILKRLQDAEILQNIGSPKNKIYVYATK